MRLEQRIKKLKPCAACKYCEVGEYERFACKLDDDYVPGRLGYIDPYSQEAMCLLWNKFCEMNTTQEDIKWIARNMIKHRKSEVGEMDMWKLLEGLPVMSG